MEGQDLATDFLTLVLVDIILNLDHIEKFK